MKIKNNFKNLDCQLVVAAFPWATEIIKPELVEGDSPDTDFIDAFCIDEYGRSFYSGVLVRDIKL